MSHFVHAFYLTRLSTDKNTSVKISIKTHPLSYKLFEFMNLVNKFKQFLNGSSMNSHHLQESILRLQQLPCRKVYLL